MTNTNNTYNWFKGDKLKIGIYGESHSESIGVRLEGLEYEKLDTDALKNFMKRRAPGQNAWSTPRKEADDVIVDTLKNGLFEAHILNTNTKPHDYSNLLITPRPGHADFTARLKYGESFKSSGGGSFSGRLTAPLCVAGFLALSYLAEKGIRISAHIKSIAGINDVSYYDSFVAQSDLADSPAGHSFFSKLHKVAEKDFPVIDDEKGNLMKQKIAEARAADDSVGGIIEVIIEGVPGGIGGPIFEGIEAKIASICFAVPACKGVEFGNGFAAAALRGSQNNDSLVFADNASDTANNSHNTEDTARASSSDNASLRLKTNRCGGILGGISVGGSVAPIVFDVAVKPTPTIAMEQQTVDLAAKQNTTIKVHGRHDPCIVPRAVPVYEAAAALALADLI
ncbi:MAG: chorismate synthase [Treponemataceae bacterium]|nr:chorismate synthase [Treponemataceae bacterium]